MNGLGLRTALASAGVGLALATVPASAGAAPPAHVPGEAVVSLEGGAFEVADLARGTSVREGVRELERRPEVRFAAPNWIAHAADAPLDQGTVAGPGGWATSQWNLGPRPGGIRMQPAWDRLAQIGRPGAAGVTVAVVDTGIAYARVPGYAPSPDFSPTQFVGGIDLVDDDSVAQDANGHGTHVAGTIAEQVTLGQPSPVEDWLAGIAYGASLMPVRVLDEHGDGSTDDVAAGILWAARHGADVINLSLNFGPAVRSCEQVPAVCAAIRRARRLGAVVVGSAGNSPAPRRNRALFPSAAPGVLGVGSTTQDGCLATYSNFRDTDLLAPGGGQARVAASRPACLDDTAPILQLTLACFPTGCADDRTQFAIRPDVGTSMSAAHASGVAALVIASGVLGPDPPPKAVTARLQCTARPSQPPRFYAGGLLDARRAIDARRVCAVPAP